MATPNNKPLAQRVLEMLPPSLLAEVRAFCVQNGDATDVIVRSGRSSDGLPVAFWPVDAVADRDSKHQVLTSLAVFASSLDACVTEYDGGLQNFWQELAAMKFGTGMDRQLKKDLSSDADFDVDDATELDDLVDSDIVKSFKNSPAYVKASDTMKKALLANMDFLTMARKFGAAIEAARVRTAERNAYLGHYNFDLAKVAGGVGFGDVADDFGGDPSDAAWNAACMKGAVMAPYYRSNSPEYTGGLGSFLKKGLKGLGKLAKGVLKTGLMSVAGPAGSLISAGVSASKRKRAASNIPDYDDPNYYPPVPSGEAPGAAVLDPVAPRMRGFGRDNNNIDFIAQELADRFISYNSVEGKALATLATAFIQWQRSQKQTSGVTRQRTMREAGNRSRGVFAYDPTARIGGGDVDDDFGGDTVGYVPLPSIVTAQGDVIIDDEAGYPMVIHAGDVSDGMGAPMRLRGQASRQRQIAQLIARARALGWTGDPIEFGDDACRAMMTGDPFVGGDAIDFFKNLFSSPETADSSEPPRAKGPRRKKGRSDDTPAPKTNRRVKQASEKSFLASSWEGLKNWFSSNPVDKTFKNRSFGGGRRQALASGLLGLLPESAANAGGSGDVLGQAGFGSGDPRADSSSDPDVLS